MNIIVNTKIRWQRWSDTFIIQNIIGFRWMFNVSTKSILLQRYKLQFKRDRFVNFIHHLEILKIRSNKNRICHSTVLKLDSMTEEFVFLKCGAKYWMIYGFSLKKKKINVKCDCMLLKILSKYESSFLLHFVIQSRQLIRDMYKKWNRLYLRRTSSFVLLQYWLKYCTWNDKTQNRSSKYHL